VLVAGEQGVAAGARVLRRDAAGATGAETGATGGYGDLLGWAVSANPDTPCPQIGYVPAHVSEFREKIKIGYSSDTYPSRIRIRYVSDTRYTPSVEYPCNVDPCRVEALAFSPSSVALPGAPSKRRPWVRSRRRAQRCLLAEGEVPAGGTRDLSLWRATSRPAKCEIPRPNHPSQVDLFVPAAGGAMPVFVDGGNGEAPRKIP
jgi:hypothetical protein